MQIRLLGPVEVWSDGVPLDAGTTRQRWVLAALAADAGRPVLVDTIVDRVWGESPPLRARETVHVYIARIRKMLAAAGTGAIVRRSNGYVLQVEPGLVDILRFRQLAAAAGAPGCPPASRLALLREAVDLWHGEPLADLTGEWPSALRQHWRQEHLETLGDWAAAEIAAGNPNAPVRRLTALVDQYPLAESLLAALLKALQVAGRSAEALDRYDRARKRLAEDLGTDPSPELQDVYRSILAGEPGAEDHGAVLTRVTSQPTTAPAVPAQLPLDVPGFTGREAALADLDRLPGAVVVAALSGTAGVGKTALGVHWAHRARHRFPDGQLFVNLRGFGPSSEATDPAEALEGFLSALGVPADQMPRDLDARVAAYRSLLADRRVLVLIDNAADADQARPLLPATTGCFAIVTSRTQLTSLVAIEGARPVPLGLLSPDEAENLLAARLGTDRVAAEPGAVQRLTAACARLPLALAIVAAHAGSQPYLSLHALADEILDGAGLDVLDAGDPSSNVRTVFSWSLHRLDPAATRLLRLLGLHPGPAVTVAAAASVAGVETREAAHLLAELARANLVTEQSRGRYAMHDLLHAYAADLARTDSDEPDRRAAEHRMLDHYLHTAAHAARTLHPHMTPLELAEPEPGAVVVPPADAAAALAWFTAEDPVLLGLIRHADRTGFDSHVWQLARSRELFAIRQGRWTGMISAQQIALGAARRAGDRAAEAQVRCGIARAHIWRGDLDEAHRNLNVALEMFVDLGDRMGQARVQHALTELFDRTGDHRTAIGHAYRALNLYESLGDQPGIARALNATGWCHTRLDEHETAVERCERALAILRAIGDRDGEAATRGSLGHALHRLDRFAEAVGHYERAIDLCRQLGERFYEADTLTHLGDTHRALGDEEAARAAWLAALDILSDLDHPNTADVRVRLGS